MSPEPPGDHGTIRVIGFSGNLARAGEVQIPNKETTIKKPTKTSMIPFLPITHDPPFFVKRMVPKPVDSQIVKTNRLAFKLSRFFPSPFSVVRSASLFFICPGKTALSAETPASVRIQKSSRPMPQFLPLSKKLIHTTFFS
jgi:hypothetical protein